MRQIRAVVIAVRNGPALLFRREAGLAAADHGGLTLLIGLERDAGHDTRRDTQLILMRFWFGSGPPGNCASLPPTAERSQIDTNETEPVDERGHLLLRRAVVAGIEQHALTAVRARIAGQHLCAEVVEGLDDAGSGHQIGKHLA